MNNILLTISQALQLVAIAPCIFVITFLFCTSRRQGENILPALYFASLCCSFSLPLLELFGELSHLQPVRGMLLFGENLTVPLSFLLIMQFLLDRVPPAPYWLILALPVVGGSPFIYAMLYANEVCLDVVNCFSTASLRTLYNVFSTALIFLLLIYKISTSSARIAVDEVDRRHKYWLIISLVSLNLVLAILDLLMISGNLPAEDVLIASTIIRIAFIYLVLTSIFAVFYELFEIDPESHGTTPRTQEQDRQLVEKIRQIMENDRLYREMGLTRKVLAEKLAISEHQASRIINAYFHKNFNELVNTYRVLEAKQRLASENSAITVIAFEVGFNSIASFNRVFKEITGVSPSEYRTRSRKAAEPSAVPIIPAAPPE